MAESQSKTGSPAAEQDKARADTESKQDKAAKEEAGIATVADNSKLEHSEGGVNTRQDAHDLGVPMEQGDPSEPVGPEDAFGPGPKRGAYENRVHTQSFTSEPVEGGGDAIRDGDGNVVDYAPNSRMVAQTPLAAVQGEVPGKKGGVETTEDDV